MKRRRTARHAPATCNSSAEKKRSVYCVTCVSEGRGLRRRTTDLSIPPLYIIAGVIDGGGGGTLLVAARCVGGALYIQCANFEL